MNVETRPAQAGAWNTRPAVACDSAFIAESLIKIVGHMKKGPLDPYIAGLPQQVDEPTLDLAARYIDDPDSIALVVEINRNPVACLLGQIAESSFPAANLGRVGHIRVCWVEPEHRKSGIAAEMVGIAENWFEIKGIRLIEVSYMVKNQIASAAWSSLGFEDFRAFAYKALK